MKRSRGFRRATVVVALVLFLSSCLGWTVQDFGSPGAGGGRIAAARVVLKNGEQLLVRNAVVQEDSLVGADPGGGGRVSLGLDQIVRLERRSLSDEGQAAIVVTSLAVAGCLALLGILHAGNEGGRSYHGT